MSENYLKKSQSYCKKWDIVTQHIRDKPIEWVNKKSKDAKNAKKIKLNKGDNKYGKGNKNTVNKRTVRRY